MEEIKCFWIDDLRDPKYSLDGERLEGVVWETDARRGRDRLMSEINNSVEVVYLDNFLGNRTITGEGILAKMSYKLEKGIFPNLKKVYLHTSDNEVLKRCLSLYKERFERNGIELLEADYSR